MWNKVTRVKSPVEPASNKHTGGIIMICVGIDVAKDKHDCFIISTEGEVLADVFTIPNNAEGFDTLLQTIHRCVRPKDKIKVGLEATGHYSYNILRFLLDCGLPTYVINPLHTNLYRKSLSLRKTKTDRIDARTIATMLMSDVDLKSYTDTAYHNCAGYILDRLSGRSWKFPFLNNSAGRQHSLLSLLDCLTAKPGGAVNGGRSPFILTARWLGWLCYLPDKLEFIVRYHVLPS